MTGIEALSLLREGDKCVKRKGWEDGVHLYSIRFEGHPSAILGSHKYNKHLEREYEMIGSFVDVCITTLDDFAYDDWEVVG